MRPAIVCFVRLELNKIAIHSFHFISTQLQQLIRMNPPRASKTEAMARIQALILTDVATGRAKRITHEVHTIAGHRELPDKSQQYLVQWQVIPSFTANLHATWEPPRNLDQCKESVFKFQVAAQYNWPVHWQYYVDNIVQWQPCSPAENVKFETVFTNIRRIYPWKSYVDIPDPSSPLAQLITHTKKGKYHMDFECMRIWDTDLEWDEDMKWNNRLPNIPLRRLYSPPVPRSTSMSQFSRSSSSSGPLTSLDTPFSRSPFTPPIANQLNTIGHEFFRSASTSTSSSAMLVEDSL